MLSKLPGFQEHHLVIGLGITRYGFQVKKQRIFGKIYIFASSSAFSFTIFTNRIPKLSDILRYQNSQTIQMS